MNEFQEIASNIEKRLIEKGGMTFDTCFIMSFLIGNLIRSELGPEGTLDVLTDLVAAINVGNQTGALQSILKKAVSDGTL